MWAKLDREYGKHGKIVQLVLGDLKALSKPDDLDYKKQVTMIRTVQTAVKDLTELNRGYEVKNQTVLDELERKMSNEMFKRWNLLLHNPASPVKLEDLPFSLSTS